MSDPIPAPGPSPTIERAPAPGRAGGRSGSRDRPLIRLIWYRIVQYLTAILAMVVLGWRATGRQSVPRSGGLLLISNHLSFFDVFFLGISSPRPLNYMARSTLFIPVLAGFIRSVGGFPIQREGVGASGMKETLRRVRAGGIVTLFPEGTRSPDGQLGPLKPGIAALVTRAGVPIVPVGLAGLFEVWPRTRLFPRPHPVRIHYGPAIYPEDLSGMETGAITAMIRQRLEESRLEAWRGLRNDLIL